ncbi:MAG: hypothetical protein NTY19_21370 [Planctomycetota bacterium]|nr:hypothetical protein [Planctomycetota bacterium]
MHPLNPLPTRQTAWTSSIAIRIILFAAVPSATTVSQAAAGDATQPPPTARMSAARILLPPSTLARLRTEAAGREPRWRAFQASLERNLSVVLNEDAYQGSRLMWISDYALGYQILKDSDPRSAARYADKALALIKSGLRDYHRGGWETRQFLARGDGLTRIFQLPEVEVMPGSLKVFLADVKTQGVKRDGDADADPVDYYRIFLQVSDSSDGPADYQEGSDWRRNGNLPNNLLDWSGADRKPAPNATYYVTSTTGHNAKLTPATLLRRQILLKTVPTASQAVLVQYVYSSPAAAGAGSDYQQTSAGDGGFNSILLDSGYAGRYLGKHIAMGLDWLDGYAGLTPDLAQEACGLLVRWSDYLRDKGYRRGAPSSNYEAGSYVSRVLTALAVADRHEQGPRLVQELLTYRTERLVPLLTGPAPSLRGGFWAEGWSYGPLAVQNLLLAGLALENTGLIPAATVERRWAGEVLRHLVSAQSSPETIFDGGDWYTYPAKLPPKALFEMLGAAASDPQDRAYANYVLQSYPGQPSIDYLDLLYRDPAAPGEFWSELPLQHFAEGTGLLTARSDWGPNPTWLALQMGNLLAADHQSYSPGQLQIRRGSDDLLINGNAPGTHQGHPATKSTFGNLIMLDDGGDKAQTYRWGMGVWYGTPGVQVRAYQAEQDYVYLSGDYRAAYSTNRKPGAGGPANELTRQVVYWRPNWIFVYDCVTTTKDSYAKQQRWHFLGPPTVSQNSFQAQSGRSRLFGCTWASVPVTTEVSAVKSGDATVQQLITQPVVPTASVHYLTVFEVAPVTASAMTSARHVSAERDVMEGIQLGDCLVLFGAAGQVSRQAVIKYSVDGPGVIRHLLVDLPPGQQYRIRIQGAADQHVVALPTGVVSFATEGIPGQLIEMAASE